MGRPAIDMTGQIYGRLTVIERSNAPAHVKDTKVAYWRCQCACGSVRTIAGASLRNGKSTSCGGRPQKAKNNGRHGYSQHQLYDTWRSMLERCHNAASPAYKNYGARGIAVCAEWRADFHAFVRNMGTRPTPTHTIERVNNDGNYEPSNCCWATPAEQANNKRTNRPLKAFGREQTKAAWCRELGVSRATVRQRLILGWSVEEAVSLPKGSVRKGA